MGERTTPTLPIDPQRIDESGLPWAFLSDAARADDILPGRFIVVGHPDDPLLARVVDVVPEGEDHIVHVEVLGPVADVERAIHAA
jgi:hypothetical protein